MADILIRDVDATVHEALKARAKAAGQTLQAYLRDLLTDEARSVDVAHWYANVRARRLGAAPVDAVATIEAARAERDAELGQR